MGMDFNADNAPLEESVVTDLGHHRRLGMHVIEYADRHGLSREELRDMLSMIGL